MVPADDKLNARLIISQVVVNTLKELEMEYPKSDEARQKELAALKLELTK